ncbi:hypothetical protein L6452_42191 [Arctium lappa]|uniref:Uncharacterized protein n=1 Tax=Arctium lappa TaxID=4217 RepID=A0ACB8XIB8_ARCLA|nr:hypothetical protein L6452_42191 [Arctium lappa]
MEIEFDDYNGVGDVSPRVNSCNALERFRRTQSKQLENPGWSVLIVVQKVMFLTFNVSPSIICEVTVWNRSKSKCDPLIDLGAK